MGKRGERIDEEVPERKSDNISGNLFVSIVVRVISFFVLFDCKKKSLLSSGIITPSSVDNHYRSWSLKSREKGPIPVIWQWASDSFEVRRRETKVDSGNLLVHGGKNFRGDSKWRNAINKKWTKKKNKDCCPWRNCVETEEGRKGEIVWTRSSQKTRVSIYHKLIE